ncbi:DUF6191 domain-containing protein [Streptomyces sp. XM4193]|uniref:DUF6191 domain-containing protein n=1 Tax=Streptomyces sp. XM4193 TaxID=2929782 RepID=UPI001FF71EBA|nr:DUF6191 domain-containing protein [Streptomyces sp. XM4193]MCK1797648.1 DUF6191 domain-containing protein [Streptomyces sp. XM4193]
MEEVFNPGAQHAEDEKQRLEHTRFEDGNNDPARGQVDLDSGRILISLPGQQAALPGPRLSETEPGQMPRQQEPEAV